jgi:bacterioferritin-associated ferredoxin
MTDDTDNLTEIICDCTGTTREKIRSLYLEGFDFEAISRKTGVNTGCGGCEWEIESFLEALQTISPTNSLPENKS